MVESLGKERRKLFLEGLRVPLVELYYFNRNFKVSNFQRCVQLSSLCTGSFLIFLKAKTTIYLACLLVLVVETLFVTLYIQSVDDEKGSIG